MGDSGQVSSSSYLIACDETERERQKELLYKVMGTDIFSVRRRRRMIQNWQSCFAADMGLTCREIFMRATTL